MTPRNAAYSRVWLWRRWNGERWLVVGTRMYRLTKRGEGKPLPRVTRTFARFEGAATRRTPKPKPDGGCFMSDETTRNAASISDPPMPRLALTRAEIARP